MPFPYAGGKVDATNVPNVVEQVQPMLYPPPAPNSPLELLEQLGYLRFPFDQRQAYSTFTRTDSNLSATPPFWIEFTGEHMEFCVIHMLTACGHM